MQRPGAVSNRTQPRIPLPGAGYPGVSGPSPTGTDLATRPSPSRRRPVSHAGTGTGSPSDIPADAPGDRWPGPGRNRSGAARFAPPAIRALHRPAGPRRDRRRRVDAVLLCVPDDRDRPGRRARSRPGPLVGHCSGATGLEVLAPHEAFSPAPADDRDHRRGRVRRCGRRDCRINTAGAGRRRGLAEALGLRPSTWPRPTVPPTTRPHRSPPTSSSPSRRRPSGWRATAGLTGRCSCRSCGQRWRTGPLSAPSAPSPGLWPEETRRRSRASARGRAARARISCHFRRPRRGDPRGWPAPRCRAGARHEDPALDRRAARGARRAPPRPGDDRPRPDDGRLSRGPPVADAPRARGVRRRGRRVAVREPGTVQRARPTSTATPATRAATPRWRPRSASTTCSRPPEDEVYPRDSRPPSPSAG